MAAKVPSDCITGEPLDPHLPKIVIRGYGGPKRKPRAIPPTLHRLQMVESIHTADTLGQLEWSIAFERYMTLADQDDKLEASRRWYLWWTEPYLVNRAYAHFGQARCKSVRHDCQPVDAVIAFYKQENYLDRHSWISQLERRYGHGLPWIERRARAITDYLREHYLLCERIAG